MIIMFHPKVNFNSGFLNEIKISTKTFDKNFDKNFEKLLTCHFFSNSFNAFFLKLDFKLEQHQIDTM